MNEVKSGVEKLVKKELEFANRKFPMFRSDHEGAAIILEQVEEVEKVLKRVRDGFCGLWNHVKNNCKEDLKYDAKWIYTSAVNLFIRSNPSSGYGAEVHRQSEREGT